jgi:hypothetical protein
MERQRVDMNSTGRLTGRLVAAGRALTGVSHSELATAAGIPLEMLRDLESSGAAWIPDNESQALGRALGTFGAVIVPERDGMGAGVRLKFTGQDARQIGRAPQVSAWHLVGLYFVLSAAYCACGNTGRHCRYLASLVTHPDPLGALHTSLRSYSLCSNCVTGRDYLA